MILQISISEIYSSQMSHRPQNYDPREQQIDEIDFQNDIKVISQGIGQIIHQLRNKEIKRYSSLKTEFQNMETSVQAQLKNMETSVQAQLKNMESLLKTELSGMKKYYSEEKAQKDRQTSTKKGDQRSVRKFRISKRSNLSVLGISCLPISSIKRKQEESLSSQGNRIIDDELQLDEKRAKPKKLGQQERSKEAQQRIKFKRRKNPQISKLKFQIHPRDVFQIKK